LLPPSLPSSSRVDIPKVMADKLKGAAEQVFKKMPKGGGGGPPTALLKAAAGLGVLGYGASNCFYTVDAGHRACVFNRFTGVKPIVYGEGLNFNIPWVEWPTIFETRTRPCNLQTQTGSKDLQKIMIGERGERENVCCVVFCLRPPTFTFDIDLFLPTNRTNQTILTKKKHSFTLIPQKRTKNQQRQESVFSIVPSLPNFPSYCSVSAQTTTRRYSPP